MSYQFEPFSEEETPEATEETARFKTAYLALAELFYPIYRYVFATNEEFVQEFDRKIQEANYSTTSEVYLSAAFGVGAIAGTVFGIFTMAIAYSVLVLGGIALPTFQFAWLAPVPAPAPLDTALRELFRLLSFLKVPVVLLLAGLLGGVFGLLIFGSAAIAVPYWRARERARQIRLVFPDAVGMMYSLAVGGMSQLAAFQKVADSEDVYGELSVEFQRIIRQTELFQRDYETAVESVADTTPNEDLEQFLTDMLSIMNAGGDFEQFLVEQKEEQNRERERSAEERLRWLETLGQAYISLQIAPMLIVVVLVVMAMVGEPKELLLILTVYVGIPALNLMYAVMVSSVKIEEPGDGYMELEGEIPIGGSHATSLSVGPASRYREAEGIFEQIWARQAQFQAVTILRNPLSFFRDNPDYLFVLTAPLSLLIVLALIATGRIAVSLSAFTEQAIVQTFGFFFVPFFVMGIPYTLFYEWGERTRQRITTTIARDLRKLANTNQTGQPLHESMRITAHDNDTPFGQELGIIYKKLQLGIPLDRGLVEFNNKYHIPRLARNVKIIEKAQEVSSEITEVLQTAAEAATRQTELEKERYTRTVLQVVVVELTFLVFLAILGGMDVHLVGTVTEIIGEDPAWPGFQAVDPQFIKLMFFHAALIQGVTSGVVAGYVQTGDLRAGTKYALLNGIIALGVWVSLQVFF